MARARRVRLLRYGAVQVKLLAALTSPLPL
jgi:hypothetical protein